MHDADTAYAVSLDAFAGPLDLLLHLVRRAEVDIADIPIATIADQFLAHVEQAEQLDVDAASEFLVMAATLMELKSRLLAPRIVSRAVDQQAPQRKADSAAEAAAAAGQDPRRLLAEQLLAYQWARGACDALERLWERWSRRWPAVPLRVEQAAVRRAIAAQRQARELEELRLSDLTRAYEALLSRVDFARVGAHRVQLDEVDEPIEVHAARLVEALRSAPGQPLGAALRGRSRAEVVGMFLALLELLRDGAVAIEDVEGESATLASLRLRLVEQRGAEASSQTAPAAHERT